jgi:hypothetical protein
MVPMRAVEYSASKFLDIGYAFGALWDVQEPISSKQNARMPHKRVVGGAIKKFYPPEVLIL